MGKIVNSTTKSSPSVADSAVRKEHVRFDIFMSLFSDLMNEALFFFSTAEIIKENFTLIWLCWLVGFNKNL